ncbi:uncharacterized protein LOC113473331 [Diaphorina citri]|uniref:Uncharacterized protein LOC113473331 n=1 Tax=Diaphorina citri TaxID=121845 RepID=A0A3Q0JPN9_DIACI|nr:uncharacterized protein LOC113473331 [Diaphorina citri]
MRVRELATTPVDGWESELDATVNKLDNMLHLQECDAELKKQHESLKHNGAQQVSSPVKHGAQQVSSPVKHNGAQQVSSPVKHNGVLLSPMRHPTSSHSKQHNGGDTSNVSLKHVAVSPTKEPVPVSSSHSKLQNTVDHPLRSPVDKAVYHITSK